MQISPERVTAFTAVPRPGFDCQVPSGLIANEGELAAATARLYANVDHILVETGDTSPFEGLDREHYYQQQPITNLCNAVWGRRINRIAHERGLRVLLIGSAGNFSVSYSGMEWLGWAVTHGHVFQAFKRAQTLAANGVPWRTLGAQIFGPFLPKPLWTLLLRMHGRVTRLVDYSAVNPGRISDIEAKARGANEDLTYAPQTDPLRARVAALSHGDGGNYFKGVLAEWGLSVRDPMADSRVVNYCLSVPPGEFLRGGATRSLARRTFGSRLPKAVVESERRGYQSADWYVTFGENLGQLRAEVEAISRCREASEPMDLSWLRQAANSWPTDGWARDDVMMRYRYGLLRAVSAGHFMRKVVGSN
jgi:asparagine synthase (glutamine-hydrolysing)